MAIFNSYVSLPEGILVWCWFNSRRIGKILTSRWSLLSENPFSPAILSSQGLIRIPLQFMGKSKVIKVLPAHAGTKRVILKYPRSQVSPWHTNPSVPVHLPTPTGDFPTVSSTNPPRNPAILRDRRLRVPTRSLPSSQKLRRNRAASRAASGEIYGPGLWKSGEMVNRLPTSRTWSKHMQK